MTIVFSFIILVSAIIFIFLDKSGRIGRNSIGRGVVYIAMPLLPSAAITLSILQLKDSFSSDGDVVGFITSLTESGGGVSFLVVIIIQLLAAVPVLIISAVGCADSALYERRIAQSSFGVGCLAASDRLSRLSFCATVAALVAGGISIIFCVTAVSIITKALVAQIIQLLAMAVVLTIFTFGVGLFFMVLIVPLYVLINGAGMIIYTLPFIVAVCVWGAAFCILHVFTVLFAAFALAQLYKSRAMDKKSAVIRGFVSAIPIVNIIGAISIFRIIKNEVKNSYGSY